MKRAFVAWSAFWGAILAILCACAVVFALKEFRSEIFVREMGLIFDVEIDHSRIIGLNEAKKLPHRFVHRIEPKGKIPPIKGILNVQIHALEPTLGGGSIELVRNNIAISKNAIKSGEMRYSYEINKGAFAWIVGIWGLGAIGAWLIVQIVLTFKNLPKKRESRESGANLFEVGTEKSLPLNDSTPPPNPLPQGEEEVINGAGLCPNPHLLFASQKVSKKLLDLGVSSDSAQTHCESFNGQRLLIPKNCDRWAVAQTKNNTSPSLAEGVRGWVNPQNPKDSHESNKSKRFFAQKYKMLDSHESQNLGESKNPLNFASFHSQLINAIAKTIRLRRHALPNDKSRNNSMATCHESTFTNSRKSLNLADKIFLTIAFTLCASIAIFTFWLGFPGYHATYDIHSGIGLLMDNHNPVIIPTVLNALYFYVGKHLYYLFLANLVPFYLGIFFLIAGFYLRFRSKWAIALLFPTLIGNIYFQNFIQYHSFALPMMLFCLYSLVLFLILVPLKRARMLWILLFALMFFAILWRHNAIFSMFPAFLIIVFLWLQNRGLNKKDFAKNYAKFTFLSAILCLSIVILVPKMLIRGEASHPANHLFLLQIAGACVPSNDASCFDSAWYADGKTFENVKAIYAQNPLDADSFGVRWREVETRPFKVEKLPRLKRKWVQSILKHPLNFLFHEARFIRAMWFENPISATQKYNLINWIKSAEELQTERYPNPKMLSHFPENERYVALSPLRAQIYTFLFNHKIVLNHAWGVGIGGILLIISSVLLWRNLCKSKKLITTPPNHLPQGEGESLDSFGLPPTDFFRKKVSKKKCEFTRIKRHFAYFKSTKSQ